MRGNPDPTTCDEYIYQGRLSFRCGRPIKDETTGLCGIHAAAKRKRNANDRTRADRRAANELVREQAQAHCDKLEGLGIDATPNYNPFGRGGGLYTGGVDIRNPDALLELLLHQMESP